MPQPDNLPIATRLAYILAGGQSSRFGSSKALACIDGRPQIQRLATQIVADDWQAVAISQTAKEFEPLGIRTVADIEPDQGPVAGILSGMLDLLANERSESPWALFTTCDLWLWNPLWSKLLVPDQMIPDPKGLLHYFRSSVHSGTAETIPFVPFPCAIHRDALPTIQHAWQAGCRSMRELIASLGSKAIAQVISKDLLPLSFNTLYDLERLQRRVALDASHTPQ
jgi:molybdopterin-guanine dinucleotide biosynthesis protein A